MNLGDNRWHRKYVCDKCGEPIPYIAQKGIPVNKYYKSTGSNPIKADFDLCNSCEKKLKEWLRTKEIPKPKDLKYKFPVYEEE